MMMTGDQESIRFSAVIKDFYQARGRAVWEEIRAYLTGKPADLLSYEEVRQKLKVSGGFKRGLQEIPLDAIVGSVGRYADFTRSFLPKRDQDWTRWIRVEQAMAAPGGLPPIEVYQIGQVYFVLDGNHRVSVARQWGATHIEADVTEFICRVPLSPNIQLDELICKAEYADFLELTRLDVLRPGVDLNLTAPGHYRLLAEQIEAQSHRLEQEQGRPIPYSEAVSYWYDQVYSPVVQIIRTRTLLQDFPKRTETDLYVWIVKHRLELAQFLGWEVYPGVAAADLVTQFSSRPQRVTARLKEKVLDALTPDELEAGPPPGQWRREQVATHHDSHLFSDILVPINGKAADWEVLEQALLVAQQEQGRLHGLHVVATTTQKDSQAARQVQAEFNRRCQAAGVPGELAIEVGGIARKICERAHWTDLVVVGLTHPPTPQPVSRLNSGFGTLIRRCARPVLAVPKTASPLRRVLLAYDGSPKAEEALFVATYLAGQWQISLVVVTVLEGERVSPATIGRAQTYMEKHGAPATWVQERGPVAAAILKTALAGESDLILMGGYGFGPILEVMLGSTVDHVLRAWQRPVLICR